MARARRSIAALRTESDVLRERIDPTRQRSSAERFPSTLLTGLGNYSAIARRSATGRRFADCPFHALDPSAPSSTKKLRPCVCAKLNGQSAGRAHFHRVSHRMHWWIVGRGAQFVVDRLLVRRTDSTAPTILVCIHKETYRATSRNRRRRWATWRIRAQKLRRRNRLTCREGWGRRRRLRLSHRCAI